MKINIITNPRSGSTYFYNMLVLFYSPYQHFHMWNEPFNLDTKSHGKNIDELLHEANMRTEIVLKHHCTFFNFMEPYQLDKLKNMKNFYNIVLIRKDLLQTAISLAISTHKGEWTSYTDTKITIPVDEFLKYLETIYVNTKEIINNKHGFKYDEIVYYENLKFNHNEDFNLTMLSKTYDYKKMRGYYPEINLYKKSDKIKPAPDKENILENYNEIYEAGINYLQGKGTKNFGIRDGKLWRINCNTLNRNLL